MYLTCKIGINKFSSRKTWTVSYKNRHLFLREAMALVFAYPFSPSHLSTPKFSLHNIYKIRPLVIRIWELIKQSILLKIKNKFLSNLYNEKYELKMGGFNNTTETKRVNPGLNLTHLRATQPSILIVVSTLSLSPPAEISACSVFWFEKDSWDTNTSFIFETIFGEYLTEFLGRSGSITSLVYKQ